MSYVKPLSSPDSGTLTLAVLFPAGVILIELVTGLCADAFFDPLPTFGHLLLVAAVPAVNLLLWRAARREAEVAPRWLVMAGGAAAAVSAAYALLMLPILPIALIGIVLLGIGLLPFAPLLTLYFACRWTALTLPERHGPRQAAAGAAIGLLLLVLVDVPATATHIALRNYAGDADARRSAVSMMRTLGDEEVLLRLSYGDTARATGLVSFLVSSSENDIWSDHRADARELYYRVTGTPFNLVEAPGTGFLGRRRPAFAWDDDQGGETVGGRVAGLSLASSMIDGSVATADNLGYFEWTVEVANAAQTEHEARFTLALPEGAVASRATLWVNGEPREASIAGRAAVRAAYSRIVSSSRDPLLVTTSGPQRLLVQAFPILPDSRMKLRIGFTAPFEIAPDGRRSLALPAIVERNFTVPRDLSHRVWIEGDGRIASTSAHIRAAGPALRGAIDDETLAAHRPRIAAERVTAPSVRTGSVPAEGKARAISVAQTIAREAAPWPGTVMILLDGSAGNRAAAEALAGALGAIPAGRPVGLTIAAETPVDVPPAPWSPVQQLRLTEAIRSTTFAGGEDNLPALAKAIEAIPGGGGTILWIHGPQPVDFARSQGEVEQLLTRSPRLPRLLRYQQVPGRAFALPGSRWFEGAAEIPPSADPAGDLRAILGRAATGDPVWTVTRTGTAGGGQGSRHIARLWAASRIAAQAGATGEPREAAIALARRLNLITPLSGAVVLETDRDYGANGLPVPSAEDVPTVPEPGTWALLAVLAAFGLWLYRQRRPAFA